MSASASISSASLRSPAARACRDVMQCVFAFLTLKELVHVARCCVQWDKWAVLQMGRTDEVTVRSHFPALVRSRLLRHVGEIVSVHGCRIEDINHLAGATTVLTKMAIVADIHLNWSRVAFRLPSSLTELTLSIGAHVADVASDVFHAVSLRKLDLNVTGAVGLPASSFLGILRLTQLDSLEISYEAQIGAEHLAVIKQMASLRYLSLFGGHWFDYEFATLCDPPHALTCLQDIRLNRTHMNDKHIEFLQHVPTLTRLNPQSMTTSALHLLRHHLPPACVDLEVHISTDPVGSGLDELCAIDLTRIQILRVWSMDFANEEGVRFLSTCLPAITDLQLWYASVPLDLTCLRMPTLRKFAIVGSAHAGNPYEPTRRPNPTNMPALTELDVFSFD